VFPAVPRGKTGERRPVKIVIAGPPKAGNVWLKCLLSNAYELRPLGPKLTPDRPLLADFIDWVERGGFKDGTIFHQHYDYSAELCERMAAAGAKIVTIIRDPYDMFVSTYYTLQNYQDSDLRRGRPSDIIIGKPLDHPDVMAYLREQGFRRNIWIAKEWVESGRTAVVRYEDLHRAPIATLERLAAALGPVSQGKLTEAVETCSAENMRKQPGERAKHVRTATIGDSKKRLNDEHLAIIRECYGDLIRSLDYDVRESVATAGVDSPPVDDPSAR